MEFDRIGKYQILGEIGRGTMGRVFRGLDPALNRPVAVKTLSLALGVARDARERFRREAQAAALLSHPNIVTVYDFGEEHGHIFMAMEFLEGIDLRTAISDGLLPALSDKLRVMDQVLAGLAFAHSRGVVHRDLKPANVHIQPTGQVKILDFGLARVSGAELTQAGVVMGTPNYMAPEQALGDRVDSRADVFAAGAVFYELLSGRKPFDAETTPAVLFQVVHKAHKRLAEIAPRVPAILAEIVEKALDKNRENRFATGRQMRAALAVARTAIEEGRGDSTTLADESRRALVTASGETPRPVIPGALPGDSGPVIPLTDGAVALAPRSIPPLEARSSGTLSGRASTGVDGAKRRPGGRLVALGILAVAVVAGVAYWMQIGPQQAPHSENPRVRALTAALVASEIELAREALADKRYAKAASSAEKALGLEPRASEAGRILAEARSRMAEVERLAKSAREALDVADVEGASQALARLLEIDPTTPAAADLSSTLNSAFRVRAVEAQEQMKASRQAAEAAGASRSEAYGAAVALTRTAEGLTAQGEHAEAARAFLEARDGFDRGLRAERAQKETRTSDTKARASDSPPAHTATLSPAPSASPTTLPEEAALPERRFSTTRTILAGEARGTKPEGFDTSDVKARKAPELLGRIEFDMEPTAPRPGDLVHVRVFFTNEGRKGARLRNVVLSVSQATERTSVRSVAPLVREVKPQRRETVAEWSGTLPSGPGAWTLDVLIGSEASETAGSRLEWQ